MPRIEEYPDAPALTGAEFVPVSVLVGSQYVTRRTTTQAIANKASAGGSTGESDPFDAIRTWLAPYNVGPNGAAADNVAGINAAISAAAASGGGSARVLLPQGRITTNAPIIMRSGVHLVGQGTSEQNGTELFLASGSNHPVIADAHWWDHLDYLDWASVSHLRINGNKAGNTSSYGIVVYAAGEELSFNNLNVRNCANYGIYFQGPALCFYGRNISMVACNLPGIIISGNDGSYVFDNCRAELGLNLLQCHGGNSGGGWMTSVQLNGCRQDNCSGAVVDLVNWGGCTIINGGTFRAASKVSPIVNIAVALPTAQLGPVIFPMSVYQQNFTRLIQHPSGGYNNVEFDNAIANGGWVNSVWWPGDLLFLRSGVRIGMSPDHRAIIWSDGLPGTPTSGANSTGVVNTAGFHHQETYVDRYIHQTVTQWVNG